MFQHVSAYINQFEKSEQLVLFELLYVKVMEKKCICKRLYKVNEPTILSECAFSGSLSLVRQYETSDGLRFCLTIFNLYDYNHLHFPHDEYKLLIGYLYALQSTQTISPSKNGLDVQTFKEHFLKIKRCSMNGSFKIKFGKYSLTFGPITAFGLVKTSPFSEVDVFFTNNAQHFTCIPECDICVCKKCPIFKRVVEFEAEFRHCRPENVNFFQ